MLSSLGSSLPNTQREGLLCLRMLLVNFSHGRFLRRCTRAVVCLLIVLEAILCGFSSCRCSRVCSSFVWMMIKMGSTCCHGWCSIPDDHGISNTPIFSIFFLLAQWKQHLIFMTNKSNNFNLLYDIHRMISKGQSRGGSYLKLISQMIIVSWYSTVKGRICLWLGIVFSSLASQLGFYGKVEHSILDGMRFPQILSSSMLKIFIIAK